MGRHGQHHNEEAKQKINVIPLCRPCHDSVDHGAVSITFA